jgi:hypothetical protein
MLTMTRLALNRPCVRIAAALLAAPASAQPCEPAWSALGDGLGSDQFWLAALEVFDDGSGTALYAGGTFSEESGAPARGIARWDGATWASVGGGGTDDYGVNDMVVFDDGAGPALYVVGYFSSIAGVPAQRVARWDGASWTEVGGGVEAISPSAIAVFDDGSGEALYLGGWGDGPALVRKLQGGDWVPVGTLNGLADRFGCEYLPIVRDLEVFDDGSGPALYAGGTFYRDNGPDFYINIARWDGQEWSAIGSGGQSVRCIWTLEPFDDGSGPAIYAGGYGGADRWNGLEWSQVPGVGSRTIKSMLAHDDGSGQALFFGGQFDSIGGIAAGSIARWDGSAWSPLGTGLLQDGQTATVEALHEGLDDSTTLFALGYFTSAGGGPALGIAQWGCDPPPCAADCDASGAVDVAGWFCFVALFNTADPAADCDGAGGLDLCDFLCFVNAFNAGC